MFDESLLPFIAKISPTIMWIALTVGLLLFIIGYFAGAKLTLGRIWMCVLIVIIVGTLALPAPMTLFSLVAERENVKTVKLPKEKATPTANDKQSTAQSQAKTSPSESKTEVVEIDENVPLQLQILTFFLYIAWIGFLVAMGIFLYETWTVTAQEAEKR
jgi:hypothetical protein